MAEAKLFNLKFNLIDTAGFNQNKGSELLCKIKEQTESAIKSANLILFVVDVKTGITAHDKALSSWLREKNLPIILVVNKCDDEKQFSAKMAEFYELGHNNICALSSEHNLGFESLHKLMSQYIVPGQKKVAEARQFRISILGRPNTGKSTLINVFLGENRLITGPEAGITRGSTSVELKYKGRTIQITDTAGMRKKNKIQNKVEQLSVGQVIEAINASHVVVLLLDANNPFEEQDLKIASLILRHLKPLIIVVNKIDSIKFCKTFKEEIKFIVQNKLAQQGISIIYASALQRKNIHKILDECIKLYDSRGTKIPTSKLNAWLRKATNEHQLPLLSSGHRLKIKFISQTQLYPPTFQIFISNPEALLNSYLKYLINSMKDHFPQLCGPVNIKKVKAKNPYV